MRASLAVLVLCASSSFAADRTATPFDRSMLAGPLAVCVHLPGGYTEIQQGALLPLGIRKIRTDVFYDNPASPEILKFSEGWDVLGIMLNEHGERGRALFREFDEDPEKFIDRYVQALPWIQHWEFGNETDNFAKISPEAYVGYLKKAYPVFRRKYPHLTLVSASPMGNDNGAKYLKRMIQAGLLSMPDLVIGVHVYDGKPKDFKVAGRRVWVTESGAQWNKQQDHWKGQIRKTMNEVKPERLYWYANWENQPPGKGDGWISIAEGGRVIPSPLYSQLLLSAEPQP